MQIIYNPANNYQKVTDSPSEYNGKIEIEYRGNSSLGHPKKSFAFETKDITGNSDQDYPILGMPAENDWILLANYLDPTLMKNELMHWLWGFTGYYNVKTRCVEVVLNGKYIGVYLLTEKIKRDDYRLDMNNLKPNEISGENLTGGYIVKRDSRDPGDLNYWSSAYLTNDKYFIVVDPKESDLQPEQFNYIKGYFNSFENALHSNNYTDSTLGYSQYIDIKSFVDYFIIQEFALNPDGFDGSQYYHKDKNGKLRAGPVWDFDEALSNSLECTSTNNSIGWIHSSFPCLNSNTIFWWQKFTQDCNFSNYFFTEYNQFRFSFLNQSVIFNHIDSLSNLLSESSFRNNKAWEIGGNYNSKINELKTWLINRFVFMDNNIKNIIRSSPKINQASTTANFGTSISLTSTACQNTGQLKWKWNSEHFNGESISSSFSFIAQNNIEVQAFCEYPYGCISMPVNKFYLTLPTSNNGCGNNINLSGNIIPSSTFPNRKYQSSNTIQSNSKILGNQKLLFQASNFVDLKPGFEIQPGAVFKAWVNPCNSN